MVPCVWFKVFVRPFQLLCVFDFRPRFHHHTHAHGPCWTAPSVIQTNPRHSNFLCIDNMGLFYLFLVARGCYAGFEVVSEADHVRVVQTADATSLADNKDTISRIRGFKPGILCAICI
jgi:hypothetical protein